MISKSRLPNGTIAVYELEISEDSAVTKGSLAELPLAGRCLIGAIHRDGFVRVPTADDQLQAGDIVVALIDSASPDDVLSLFH